MYSFSPAVCVAAVAGLIAGSVSAQAVDDPWTPGRATSAALRELAPAQPYPVPPIRVAPPLPLPEPLPVDGQTDAAGTGNSLLPASADILLVDASYGGTWSFIQAESRKIGVKPGVGHSPLSVQSAGSMDTWVLGAENWRYSRDGANVVIGNKWSEGSVLGEKARLGGIALSQSIDGGGRASGHWQYSVMLGALDYSGDAGKQGGLTYGPTAGESVLHYGISRRFSLETQVQWAENLLVSGVGGKYTTRGWGAWQAAVARAAREPGQGWRYRVGYEADVLESLHLGWTHDESSQGFSDLADYQNFSPDSGRNRHVWTARLALGRWGSLKGSFERVASASGDQKRQFGLSQQFWYSPNLRISLRAERELVTGNYGVGVDFAVPLY